MPSNNTKPHPTKASIPSKLPLLDNFSLLCKRLNNAHNVRRNFFLFRSSVLQINE